MKYDTHYCIRKDGYAEFKWYQDDIKCHIAYYIHKIYSSTHLNRHDVIIDIVIGSLLFKPKLFQHFDEKCQKLMSWPVAGVRHIHMRPTD